MNNNSLSKEPNFRFSKNSDKRNLTTFFVLAVLFYSSNHLLPLSVKSISLSNRAYHTKSLAA